MSTVSEHKKSRKIGRPPIDSEMVRARIERPLLAALDAYAASADPFTRPQAIRNILADWLAAHGFMKRDGHGGADPIGPATDAVAAMDEAIGTDRAKPKRRKP